MSAPEKKPKRNLVKAAIRRATNPPPRSAAHTFEIIADYADWETGRNAYPSLNRISRRTRRGKRATQYHVRTLLSGHHIDRQAEPDAHVKAAYDALPPDARPPVYRIVLDTLALPQAVEIHDGTFKHCDLCNPQRPKEHAALIARGKEQKGDAKLHPETDPEGDAKVASRGMQAVASEGMQAVASNQSRHHPRKTTSYSSGVETSTRPKDNHERETIALSVSDRTALESEAAHMGSHEEWDAWWKTLSPEARAEYFRRCEEKSQQETRDAIEEDVRLIKRALRHDDGTLSEWERANLPGILEAVDSALLEEREPSEKQRMVLYGVALKLKMQDDHS